MTTASNSLSLMKHALAAAATRILLSVYPNSGGRSLIGVNRCASALSHSGKCETIALCRHPIPARFCARCSTPPLRRPTRRCRSAASARAAQGANHRRRRGQGGGGDGGGGGNALARAAGRARRHPRRPWRADKAHPGRRGRASDPGRRRHGGGARNPGADARPDERRSRARPHLRAAGRRCCRCRQARLRSPTSRRSPARSCKSGARIGEMNAVRKHLSAIKGGRLAIAAAPARVVSLDHFRRAGRRPLGDRIRPDGRRRHDP